MNGGFGAKLLARAVAILANGKCPICGKPYPCLDH